MFDTNTMQVGIQIDNKIPIDPTDASAYAGELGDTRNDSSNKLVMQTVPNQRRDRNTRCRQ